MISKDKFKLSMEKIYTAHDRQITDPKWLSQVLKVWYEEMKNLTEKQFSILTQRMLYAPKISLYYFLKSLPDYQNEMSISEYTEKRNEERRYGFKR